MRVRKACPVVLRVRQGGIEILAFEHPSAGRQIVKGGIEQDESDQDAACRELTEECGIVPGPERRRLGRSTAIAAGEAWCFVLCQADGLPERWSHRTSDDGGHVFRFFWHPLHGDMGTGWDPMFVRAIRWIAKRIGPDCRYVISAGSTPSDSDRGYVRCRQVS